MNQHREDDAETPEPEGGPDPAGTTEQLMDDIVTGLLALVDGQQIASSVSVPLRSLAGRWREPFARVAVLGEVSVGKSTLINALLERPLLPSAVPALSSVPVELYFGPEVRGTVTLYDAGRGGVVQRDLDGKQEIDDYLTEAGERTVTNRHGRGAQVLSALVQVPAEVLAGGLRLVDTPGVGGANPAHRRLTLAALSDADAVLFVVRSGEPLSSSEQDFLAQAAQRVDSVAVVQAQSDLAWEAGDRLADDLARLRTPSTWAEVSDDKEAADRIARLMSGVEGLPVSARLALDARAAAPGPQREEDLELSGLPELEEWLRTHVVQRVEEIHRRDMVRLTESTVRAVRRRLEESHEILRGDEEAQRAIDERARRIAEWERTDGDSWRKHINGALTSLAEDLPAQAAARVAALRTEYQDRFDDMNRDQRKGALETLPKEPQAALDDMVTTVQERLKEAVRVIAERDGKGVIAEHLRRLGDSAEVSVRIPARKKLSDSTMEQMANAFVMAKAAFFRSRLQRRDEADAAGTGESTGAAESDDASTKLALFTSLALGTVKELFARRASGRQDLVTLFDRVAKAVTGEVVTVALKEAEQGCESVTTVIDDLLAEQREEVERDRHDLRLAQELSPAERAERLAATTLWLRELDGLADRLAVVRERWAL
ncbi:dynamin family protein [Streptomyces sp. ME02-6991-2A]|uniref:dynamin family protein n=1 Tax=Streptomyces sp. ME02-6991-2A TaxID=3028677 RepID=UPI0029AE7322|nr:dynamin family protein [Streptomyces sp. ME02-6991-2A]MDX3378482.1 dynamin family protein [Streptomyces sp. ME02-6991-2A]